MLLFTPGPTPVPESIRQAMATETLHHRTPEFEAIFAKTREGVLKLLGTDEAVMLALAVAWIVVLAVVTSVAFRRIAGGSNSHPPTFRALA